MMTTYIAQKIKNAYDNNGINEGKAKYRAFFVNTRLYLRYKADVDSILAVDGYDACIITE